MMSPVASSLNCMLALQKLCDPAKLAAVWQASHAK
jgi:hypothetical protein